MPQTSDTPPSGTLGTPDNPVSPVLVGEEPAIDWSVLILYVIIVAFLGSALVYSLNLGPDYLSFSASLVTALTTIAGFAIGVNAAPPKTEG
jgi:hypothetical protein